MVVLLHALITRLVCLLCADDDVVLLNTEQVGVCVVVSRSYSTAAVDVCHVWWFAR